MISKRRILVNGAVLAAVGIIIRTVAVSFNGYVSRRLGAEGMGLYSLVMSVYGLGVTLATSGVNLAVVRMISEALAAGGGREEITGTVRRGLLYALAFGLLSGGIIYFSADITGTTVLGDDRCVLSLKAMAVGMPPIAMASALSGYFTGVGRAYKSGAVMVCEQCLRIVLILTSMVILLPRGTEYGCLGLVAGASAAEALSLAASYILYLWDRRRICPRGCVTGNKMKRLASISLPVATGSYVRQGLTTAEHIAIPHGLRGRGATPGAALASYGVLHGMALPLVLYPSAVVGAFTGLLIPELAAMAEMGQREEVRRLSLCAVRWVTAFSVGVAVALGFFGYELGMGIYSSEEAGRYIRLLAPLVPMMFLDTTVDCILKGLGEERFTMKVNIIDAAICLAFVLILVPVMGIMGYVTVIYVSEAVNATMSICRMQNRAAVRLTGSLMLLPYLWAAAAVATVSIIDIICVCGVGVRVGPWMRIIEYAAVYVLFTVISELISKNRGEKVQNTKKLQKNRKNFQKGIAFSNGL